MMAHTYASLYAHCVFATKCRRRILDEGIRDRLWAYMGGIARANKFLAPAIGGAADHAHVLLTIPASMPLAKAVQLIKGGSSKWISEQFHAYHNFAWQEGYGAFSIGLTQVESTSAYIANQEDWHRRKTFREEYLEILELHQIAYEEAHVFEWK